MISADEVLRCVLLGDIPAWPLALIAVATGAENPREIETLLATLTEQDQLRGDEQGHYTAPHRYRWRHPLVRREDPEHPAWERAAYDRLGEFLLARAERVDDEPGREDAMPTAAACRALVSPFLHRLTALGQPERTVRIARAWWEIADRISTGPDDPWMAALHRVGLDAALAAGSAVLLCAVCEAGARCAYRVEATHWSSAIDALFDLIRTHERLEQPDSVAWALLRLGALMLHCQRANDAVEHLRRARSLLDQQATERIGADTGHTRTDLDILLGRALWEHGDPRKARKIWRHVLDQLPRTDVHRTDALRELITLPDEATLHRDPMIPALIGSAES